MMLMMMRDVSSPHSSACAAGIRGRYPGHHEVLRSLPKVLSFSCADKAGRVQQFCDGRTAPEIHDLTHIGNQFCRDEHSVQLESHITKGIHRSTRHVSCIIEAGHGTLRTPPFSRSASTAEAAATMPAWPKAVPSTSLFSCCMVRYMLPYACQDHCTPDMHYKSAWSMPLASPLLRNQTHIVQSKPTSPAEWPWGDTSSLALMGTQPVYRMGPFTMRTSHKASDSMPI